LTLTLGDREMRRRGPTDHEVLEFVMTTGEEGILQSELWKRLKADSREGSRAILRLEKKKLIRRNRELHSGRWTYRVFSARKLSTIDSIMNIPCAFCEYDLTVKCPTLGLNPSNCPKLTEWLLTTIRGKSVDTRTSADEPNT